jgi:hypothetical protein
VTWRPRLILAFGKQIMDFGCFGTKIEVLSTVFQQVFTFGEMVTKSQIIEGKKEY